MVNVKYISFLIVAALVVLASCSSTHSETKSDLVSPETGKTETDKTESAAEAEAQVPLWDKNLAYQTTESGIKYRFLTRSTDSGKSPTAEDRVKVHYEGQLLDGEVFDSSYERGEPATFGLNQVIKGWTEGLQLMKEGDVAILNIPSELAYGEQTRAGGKIKPNSDLVFKVELLEIMKVMKITAEAWEKYTPWDSENPDVRTTESGLGIIVLESGDADGVSPAINQQCVVHYEGRLSDGETVFDSSFARNDPISFAPNQVIPGWTEALTQMKPGDRWMVHLPSEIAYGARNMGPIPANSDLIFEIALLEVK